MTTALLHRLSHPLRTFFWSLPWLAERAPVLALVHDGTALVGAVLARRGAAWVVSGTGRSSAVVFGTAVGEVLQQCGTPAQRALLASASAITALVDLPIEADQPKPAREMLGLVRWELEPLMAEQVARWQLGALLQTRGHIDAQGRAALEAEQARRQATGGGAVQRFGEIAVELGLAQREQVEECLAAQTQLQSLDDQVVCAWSDQGTPSGDGRSLWLSAGIGLSVQGRWVDACRRHGLRLEAIAPLACASLAANDAALANGVFVEANALEAVVLRLRAGRPERLALRTLPGADAADALQRMLTDCLLPGDPVIRAFLPRPDATAITTALSAATGRGVEPIVSATASAAVPRQADAHPAVQAWLPVLEGLARMPAARGAHPLPRLPAAEPLPPPLRRPQAWATAGALLLALGVGAYETGATLRMHWMQRELGELAGVKARNEQQQAKASEERRQAAGVLKQVEQVQAEQRNAQQALDFYRAELDGRREFMSRTLASLPQAVSSEVVLDSVEEARWFELTVKAWSISQSAAYRFAKDLAASLAPWRFEVRDLQVKAQSGRSGQDGYGLQFSLVRSAGPLAPASAASASAPAQGGAR